MGVRSKSEFLCVLINEYGGNNLTPMVEGLTRSSTVFLCPCTSLSISLALSSSSLALFLAFSSASSAFAICSFSSLLRKTGTAGWTLLYRVARSPGHAAGL